MCQCKCQIINDVNPNQIELGLNDTRYPEFYENGYAIGIHWCVNWMPGGPYVYQGHNTHHRKESEAQNEIWKKGFKAGLAANFEANPDYKEWWDNRTNMHRKYENHPSAIAERQSQLI